MIIHKVAFRWFMLTIVSGIGATALAQMPVPLREIDATVDPKVWQAAEPLFRAGLECRERLDPENPTLRPLLAENGDGGQWKFVPPKGFAVFGLQVVEIVIYVDPDGEMGASYTASVIATKASAAEATKLGSQRKTSIGSIEVEQGIRVSLTDITCTVTGARVPD